MKQKRQRSIAFLSSLRKKRSIVDIKRRRRKENRRRKPSRRESGMKLMKLRDRDV